MNVIKLHVLLSVMNTNWWLDDSNKDIIDRLTKQWKSLPEQQKQPYYAILKEDTKHYQQVIQQEDER